MLNNFHNLFLKAILLSFVFLIFASSVESADYSTYDGTIVLKNGTKYEDISFKINSRFKTLTFKLEDEKKHVSFTNVDKIYDSEGDDITDQVLGNYYKPKADIQEDKKAEKKEEKQAEIQLVDQNPVSNEIKQEDRWLSQDSKVYKKSQEKLWNTAIIIAPGYSIPSGFYYTGTTGGIGFGADLLLSLSRETTLRFSASKANITLKPPFDFLSTNTYRYIVSFQYNKPLEQEIVDKSMYYFYSGLGTTNDELDTHFTMTAGGGIIKMMSEEIGLNFELRLDLPGAYDESMQAVIIDLRFGLAAVF